MSDFSICPRIWSSDVASLSEVLLASFGTLLILNTFSNRTLVALVTPSLKFRLAVSFHRVRAMLFKVGMPVCGTSQRGLLALVTCPVWILAKAGAYVSSLLGSSSLGDV